GPRNAAGAECLDGGSDDSTVRAAYHFPELLIPFEALGLGEFERLARAHRVHVCWIVHAAEHNLARRLGCDELNTSDGLALEGLGNPPRLPRRLKGVSGEGVTRAVKDLHSHRRLLRPRRDWPRSRATTNYFDELAPSHCLPRGSGQGIVAAKTSAPEGSSMSALGQKRTLDPLRCLW